MELRDIVVVRNKSEVLETFLWGNGSDTRYYPVPPGQTALVPVEAWRTSGSPPWAEVLGMYSQSEAWPAQGVGPVAELCGLDELGWETLFSRVAEGVRYHDLFCPDCQTRFGDPRVLWRHQQDTNHMAFPEGLEKEGSREGAEQGQVALKRRRGRPRKQ